MINFIKGLQLFNGSQPLTNSDYKEIGTLFQIQQDGKNIPTTNNTPINKDDFYSPTPIPKPRPKTSSNLPVSNDEYKLYPKNRYHNSILGYYPYPPLIGLQNIGATCYMNATLQCFCNIQKFVNYFKFNNHLINEVANDINKSKLISSFKLLIEKLWPDNLNNSDKYYAPYDYKDKISKMNPLFKGVQANDSKD